MVFDASAHSARLAQIRDLLKTWNPTIAENNEAFNCRADLVFVLEQLDDSKELLEEALPHLRNHAHNCEACQGAGEIPTSYDTAEPCKHCKPIWDLVERIRPPAPPPQPVPVSTAEEYDDDLPF